MTSGEWRRLVVHEAQKLSDRGYQERTWFGGGAQICSPEEHYCGLLDDFLFDEFLVDDQIALNDQQRSAGIALKHVLEAYFEALDEPFDPRGVIDDPQWEEVRCLAKAFVHAMKIAR
jgi:hypothetical protein